jgi:hypothetical protein
MCNVINDLILRVPNHKDSCNLLDAIALTSDRGIYMPLLCILLLSAEILDNTHEVILIDFFVLPRPL